MVPAGSCPNKTTYQLKTLPLDAKTNSSLLPITFFKMPMTNYAYTVDIPSARPVTPKVSRHHPDTRPPTNWPSHQRDLPYTCSIGRNGLDTLEHHDKWFSHHESIANIEKTTSFSSDSIEIKLVNLPESVEPPSRKSLLVPSYKFWYKFW